MRLKSVEKKSFAIMLICVMVLCAGFLLSACGDKYAGLGIEVDRTEISLRLGGNADAPDDTPLTATLQATLVGASAEMTRGMSFRFDDTSIVTAQIVNNYGDMNVVSLTATTAGTTKMYLVSNEHGSVVSDPITVTVYRDAESMVFDTTKKPSVKAGTSIVLDTSELINFSIGGESAKIYPSEAEFSLLEPSDPRWNAAYGTSIPNGVSIQDNVLSAANNASLGIVQVLATRGALSTVCYVMVYSDINAQEVITLYQNEALVTGAVKSIINPVEANGNRMVLIPQITDTRQNYQLAVTSRDNDVLLVGEPNASGQVSAAVCNSGRTKLDVVANIIDPFTGVIYQSFTKTYDVQIDRIVTEIRVYSDDVSPTAEPVRMTVQDVYVNGVAGKKVHYNVYPDNDEHSGAIADTNIKLAVTRIDGADGEYSSVNGFDDVVVMVDGQEYVWGETIPNDKDIFVSLGQTDLISQNFRLTLLANTMDASLPQVSNHIDFDVAVGVTRIDASSSRILLGVGMSSDFGLTYYDNQNNAMTGAPKFSFSTSDIFTISPKGDYDYSVVANREGDTTIVITAESGARAEIELQVRTVLNSMGIITHSTQGVLSSTMAAEEADALVANTGIAEITITVGSEVDLGYVLNPVTTGSDSFRISSVGTDDPEKHYVSIASAFAGGKLHVSGLNPTGENHVTLTIVFEHYVNSEGIVQKVTSSREVAIKVYKPLSNLYWQGTASQKTITRNVYNANKLNYIDNPKGTITLAVRYDPTASYFANGGEIVWTVDDSTRVIIAETETEGEILVTGNLSVTDTARYYTVNITARVDEYNVTYLLKCVLTIENPVKVDGINLRNYYDDYYGIRLSDLGSRDRTQYEIVPEVTPSDAFNKKLKYVLLTTDKSAEVSSEDAIITLDPDNPNIIRAVEGKSGSCYLRLYPEDALWNRELTFADVPLYKDIYIVVENGDDAPYTIYEPAEFLAIGVSPLAMTKNYILMNSIDLSAYSRSLFPLGGEEPFSGTLRACYDAETDTYSRLSISGLPVVSNAVTVGDNTYLGVFSQITSTAAGGAISNIDFYFDSGSIDFLGSDLSENVYAGLLAGRITGDLNNVFVNYSNYRTNEVVVANMPSSVQNFYFGAVAGDYADGSVSGVYANLSLRLASVPVSTALIVGGVFGQFAGVSFGQNESLMCNVNISATYSANTNAQVWSKIGQILNGQESAEGIGGLVGVTLPYAFTPDGEGATATLQKGTIRSMQVTGIISAAGSTNVGGLVGKNRINLGADNGVSGTPTLYRNLASVRVNGGANVGGFVGANYGTILYGTAEIYDNVKSTEYTDLIWVRGLYRVGGFAGYHANGAYMDYAFAMSYVDRAMQTFGLASGDATKFYGDILGGSQVGGLVGFTAGAISHSFANTQIQQVDITYPEGTTISLDRYTGGFVGVAALDTATINFSFAIGAILSSNTAATAQCGEYVGYYSGGNGAIHQAYAYVDITAQDDKVYNFAAASAAEATVSQCFFVNESTTPMTNGYTYLQMTLNNGDTIIYQQGDAHWGFTQQNATGAKQEWVAWDSTISGVNHNLPILYDKDGKMLYNQITSSITVTPREYTADGATLPTYFAYSDATSGAVLGAVVLLDNITLDSRNQRSIAISDLFNITVAPQNLSPSEWKISVESSDFGIVEVVQPRQNLIDAYLIFKDCGVVTIEFTSLLNANVVARIEINVVGGFEEFSIRDSQGRLMTASDYVMYVKVGREMGYSVHTRFDQKNNQEYITPKGLVYTTMGIDYIRFDGVAFDGYSAYMGANEATIISGVTPSADLVAVSVAPYIELTFGTQTYRNVFASLQKSFDIKVYQGITSVEVYTGVEANMPSGSEVLLGVDVVTDNIATVSLEDVDLSMLAGKLRGDIAIDRFMNLVETKQGKIATQNRFECYLDGVQITDRRAIADIVLGLKRGDSINAYISVDGTTYSSAADIAAIEDYLITDCVRFTFMLSLKGTDRQITQNVVFGLEYTIRDTESGDRYTVNDQVTFIPASITKMELKHFTYGADSMEAGETAGNSISPGTTGILRIDLMPYYAHFDYVTINSSALNGTGAMMLRQMVYKNGLYRYVSNSNEYDGAGNLILRNVTGIDADGNEYFDGRIFVSTLITSGTPEGSGYSITVAPKRNGESSPIFEPQTIRLTTAFAPFATLTMDSSYAGNIVARGSLVNLRLTGTLLNSSLTLSASYYGTEGGSRLTNCAFYDQNIQYNFTSGQRENVNMLIPFYVGLLAQPDNGKIIISVTINSYTNLGGRLNPLVVTCVINVVDYIVDKTYTRGTQTGNFEISVNSYMPLIALFVVNDPRLADFQKYIGFSTDAATAEAERAAFAEGVEALNAIRQQKIKYINALGDGNGGVWWFDDGTGFAQINTIRHYLDFLVVYDETVGQDCYKLRGRDLKTDFALRLSYETTYVYNESKGCYEFVLLDEITEDNRSLMLDDYIRKLEQDFLADLTEQSDEENPYAIDSAEAFRTSMVAGGNYMLTADIELYNWQPIDTAIASLDGNGHIIYLRSFAKSTDATSTNMGLFGTVSEGSVLKNLIVDVSHNLYINLKDIAKVRFGYIAGVNKGIIYNCDIVVTKDKSEWQTIYDNTPRINNDNADEQFGRNIFDKIINNAEEYRGYRSLASTFVMTSKTVNSTAVSSVIGGLVGENASTGSITNCRVGRVDAQSPLGTTHLSSVGGAIYARQGLNLFASGNVGGLVGENSGVISNSYFANGYVVNSLMDIYTANNTSGARTGGLVAVQTNTGRIFGSFARGQLDEDNARSSLGGVIAYGTVGGLVHSNNGVITDSYSNLNLSSASGMGGFAYENLTGARITQSYSLSTVKTQGLINGMFIGVDNEGNLLDSANSVVENCFYLTEEGTIVDSAERAIPLAKESWQDPAGSLFEGFSISLDIDGESTWYMDTARTYLGPQLYLADKVFVSSRTTLGENADYVRGSSINPLLITNMAAWSDKVFNYKDSTHKSSYIKELNIGAAKEPNYEYADAYIMLLADIDFGGAIDSITSKTRFGGHLYGNGHIISGINFTQSVNDMTAPNDFGLFASLNNATVSNLTLSIEQALTSLASHVGVLAGSITDSLVENIVLTGEVTAAKVTGTNMVGALAGFVSGDSSVYNIKSNLSISANAATIQNRPYTYYTDTVRYSANVSYAGGIIGVLDLAKFEDGDNTASPRVRNLGVKNSMYEGITVRNTNIDLSGEIVGGVVGLVGTDSEIYKVYFEVKSDSNAAHIRGRNFTGGIVGENRGAVLNARVSVPLKEQIETDSQILASDSPTKYAGIQTLFVSEGNSNAVGGLVGLNVGGLIRYSYNRVAVVNTKARVAGGLIGLAINAPQTFDTFSTVDPVLGYLRSINTNSANLLSPVSSGVRYNFGSGSMLPESGSLKAGALLQEVYTTAMVNASEVIGGLVGAQLNAPIYTYASTSIQVVGANAYDESNASFVAKVTDSTTLFGSATGYLGLNYVSTPSAGQIIAYVSNLTAGTAAQNIKVTKQVAGGTLSPIGNIAGAQSDTVTTTFISAATSSEDKPFANFDSEIWNLDNDKLEHRFPYHKIGYDSPVKDITNVDEFFEELTHTRSTSHYRIINDLVITGDRWQEFYTTTGRYSLGSDSDAVRGRVEGAVSIIADGKYTTRAANITFTNFNTTQMRYYHSLFGYTNSLKLSNLNFVYEFDFDASVLSNDLNEFALLALSTNATSMTNIGIYLREQIAETNVTKHTLSLDTSGADCGIQNMAIVTARSFNSVFNNVYFDAGISAKNMSLSIPEFSMGALVGTATGTLAIGGVDQGRVAVEYASLQNYQVNVGALVGKASGAVTLSGVVNKTGNIRGTVKVNCGGTQASHIGGVIGLCSNTLNLKNFTSNVDIILNRDNSDSFNSSIDYVGGITGTIVHSNISGACVLGDITITGGNGSLYVGGIAGTYTTPHTFGNRYSGYVTQNSSVYSDIVIGGTRDYTHLYVGGIYGLTTEQITMSGSSTEPVGDSVNVYSGLYSNADIRLNVSASYIYAGGLFGKSTQGIMTPDTSSEGQYNYTQFTRPNVVLRIANSGYVGDLIVQNSMMDGGANYLGGIVGESELLMQDLYSNGAIAYTTQGNGPAYMGGIVGLADNHIFGAVSFSVLNLSRAYDDTQNSFVDPIATVATTLVSEDNKVNILVDKAYCSPQLNGVYNKYGSVLTAAQAFDVTTAQLITANLNNWFYREVEYTIDTETTTLAIVIPEAISSMVDYSIGGEIVPMLVNEYSDLLNGMADGTYPHKTILLASDLSVANTQIAKEFNAVRRIVGNSYSFVLNTPYANSAISGDFGLFESIPNNALISSLGIKFDEIRLQTNGDATIGVLAGSNYGAVFNVSIGALPAIDLGYMGASAAQQKTVATFSNGVADRYLSSVIDSQEIATLAVTIGAGNSTIGGMFGYSAGTITNSIVSMDLSICGSSASYLNTGGMVGKLECGTLDNIMTNGRLNLSVNSTVGGLVGTATDATVLGAISNTNLGIFVPDDTLTHAGFAFGSFTGGVYKGIIVNTNISATDTDYFADNSLYSRGFTTLEMSSPEVMNYIAPRNEEGVLIPTDNGFRADIWSQDDKVYYGYPVLNTITNIDFGTGDGSQDNPYQFAETAQLLDLVNAQGEVSYCLTRDMVISPQNYAEISQIVLQITEINGMGHSIVIYDLPADLNTPAEGEADIGLFREIKYGTQVRNLGIAIVDSITIDTPLKVNFGGLAVRNYGNISNCYVICNNADNSYHSGTIEFTSSQANSYVGGLVSQNYGEISNSWCDVNFVGCEGHFGGVLGLQGVNETVAQDGSVISIRQSSIVNSFASGSIYLNTTVTAGSETTSAGGLVGKNVSYLTNGYVVRDCYVYGARIGASVAGLNVGALIGYNDSRDSNDMNVLNTYRTYAYVATDTTPNAANKPVGNYLNLGLVGNQQALDTSDNSSSLAVAYYVAGVGTPYDNNDSYRESTTEDDVATLTRPGSTVENGLRSYIIGQGIYQGWGNTSLWVRNTYGAGYNGSMLYLRGVTPIDRQEVGGASIKPNNALFEII